MRSAQRAKPGTPEAGGDGEPQTIEMVLIVVTIDVIGDAVRTNYVCQHCSGYDAEMGDNRKSVLARAPAYSPARMKP